MDGAAKNEISFFAAPFNVVLVTPTRSRKRNLKQICLWDLAQGLRIISIIQTAEAILFFVAIELPLNTYIIPFFKLKSSLFLMLGYISVYQL